MGRHADPGAPQITQIGDPAADGECMTLAEMEALSRRLRAAGAPDDTRIYSVPGHRTPLTLRLFAVFARGRS